MTFVGVLDGRYACYTTRTGIDRHWLGCRHETPRQAIAHTVPVYVSPTRSESGASYPPGEGLQSPPVGAPFSEAPESCGNSTTDASSPVTSLPTVTGDQLGH